MLTQATAMVMGLSTGTQAKVARNVSFNMTSNVTNFEVEEGNTCLSYFTPKYSHELTWASAQDIYDYDGWWFGSQYTYEEARDLYEQKALDKARLLAENLSLIHI